MSNEVIFDTESHGSPMYTQTYTSPAPKGLLAWMIEKNIVENSKQGTTYLIILITGITLLSGLLFFLSNVDFNKSQKTAQQQHQIKNMKVLMGL